MRVLTPTRRIPNILYATAIVVDIGFLFFYINGQFPSQSASFEAIPSQTETPQQEHIPPPSNPVPVALPQDYTYSPDYSSECAIRYQTDYLENLRDSAVSYCSTESSALLQCFHSRTSPERLDTFCYGTNATLHPQQHKYELPCNLRQLSKEETDKGIPPVERFVDYWYETGPKHVFDQAIVLKEHEQPPLPFSNREQYQSGQAIVLKEHEQPPPPSLEQRTISILIKREGGGNLWHSMMEIFAAFMTIDVLRSSMNPRTNAAFMSEGDKDHTQVVLLDDAPDGPYDELWSIIASKPTLRLNDITESTLGDIVVPLAGGGNPFWQADWEVRPCEDSELLRVFSSRVQNHCAVTTSAKVGDVRVTWVNRTGSRRLLDQERLLEAAKLKIPHMNIQSVDFATMSFCEQVQLARDTDVLLGVHGAGLTHTMWLSQGSVIAEILPPNLEYKGFRNMATMRGLDFFSTHGIEPPSLRRSRRADWQGKDVQINEVKFVGLLEAAVKSMYKKGMRDFDVL